MNATKTADLTRPQAHLDAERVLLNLMTRLCRADIPVECGDASEQTCRQLVNRAVATGRGHDEAIAVRDALDELSAANRRARAAVAKLADVDRAQ